MTTAANALLLYLDRYLKNNPKRRRELFDQYEKTTGKKLHPGQLWKHAERRVEPNLSTTLVYLVFLSRERELISSKTPGALFTYKHPEWLNAP